MADLKDEGNKHFGLKEYNKAMSSYDRALKLLPEGHTDSVLLHSNKAACCMMLKKCASPTQLLVHIVVSTWSQPDPIPGFGCVASMYRPPSSVDGRLGHCVQWSRSIW